MLDEFLTADRVAHSWITCQKAKVEAADWVGPEARIWNWPGLTAELEATIGIPRRDR